MNEREIINEFGKEIAYQFLSMPTETGWRTYFFVRNGKIEFSDIVSKNTKIPEATGYIDSFAVEDFEDITTGEWEQMSYDDKVDYVWNEILYRPEAWIKLNEGVRK